MTPEPTADFVGRSSELALLNAEYAADRSSFVPIYGRRRVGKSELILRFLAEHRGIYFLGKQAQAPLQIREFLEEAAVVLGEPLLATFPAEGWKQALEAVVSRFSRSPDAPKLILCFDEFQWTVEKSPELPSVLQELWDTRWRGTKQVMLILCGSYVGFMEREVLGQKSPLFGRRTAQIQLRPFGYREAALFHPDYSLLDRAKTYFICGGIPLYLRCFSSRRSIEANIASAILTEFSPLHREPDFLLREELREVEGYYSILLAMAIGSRKSAEIAMRTGIGDRALQYYFKTLLELGYISRRYPLTGKEKIARQVRYELDDPLLRFWFRFVYPNQSFIAQMGAARAIADRVRPALDSYFGHCFERLCREALPALWQKEGMSAGFEIGEYWDRDVQIDLVALRDDGLIELGECKWGNTGKTSSLEAELDAKIPHYPNPRGATIVKRLFLRDRKAGSPSGNTLIHTLEDLYAAEPKKVKTMKKSAPQPKRRTK